MKTAIYMNIKILMEAVLIMKNRFISQIRCQGTVWMSHPCDAQIGVGWGQAMLFLRSAGVEGLILTCAISSDLGEMLFPCFECQPWRCVRSALGTLS